MKRLTICLAVLALFLVGGSILGQERTAFADTELYGAVLNQLFAHEKYRQARGSVELRYTYCQSGEMQIVFHDLNEHQLMVEVWHLPPGAQPVWDQLTPLTNGRPSLTVEQAAASITVVYDSRTVEKSSGLGKTLLSGRRLEVPLARDNHIYLEGSGYEVAIVSPGRDVHVILPGPSLQAAPSSSPIFRWMGKVRAEILALEGMTDNTGQSASSPRQ